MMKDEKPASTQEWRLVPVEPTDRMLDAGDGAAAAASTHVQRTLLLIAWRAMLSSAPLPSPHEGTKAARDVLAERQRQVSVEGWTPEHDDEHADGSLAQAAVCYAAAMSTRGKSETVDVANRGECPVWGQRSFRVPLLWPDSWHAEWWKPKDRRSNLVRAGALILAEIERLDREEARNGK